MFLSYFLKILKHLIQYLKNQHIYLENNGIFYFYFPLTLFLYFINYYDNVFFQYKLMKFAAYFLGRKHIQVAKNAVAVLSVVKTLTTNTVGGSVSFTNCDNIYIFMVHLLLVTRKVLENLLEMYSEYYMHSDAFNRSKSSKQLLCDLSLKI